MRLDGFLDGETTHDTQQLSSSMFSLFPPRLILVQAFTLSMKVSPIPAEEAVSLIRLTAVA